VSTGYDTRPPAHNGGGLAPAPELPQRIRFGPRDTESVPAEWAEHFMTWIKDNRPLIFAEAMQRGVFGIEGKAGGR
jgi:hypothetical protein